MSKIKNYLEKLSVELGLDGEITQEVLTEAKRRMENKDGDFLVFQED